MPNVLIVEDDHSIAVALKDGFEYEGYDVNIAGDGLAALRVSELGIFPEISNENRLVDACHGGGTPSGLLGSGDGPAAGSARQGAAVDRRVARRRVSPHNGVRRPSLTAATRRCLPAGLAKQSLPLHGAPPIKLRGPAVPIPEEDRSER